MKPRLKRAADGSLMIVRRGSNPWGENSARRFINEHYGSLTAFAQRYRFSYGAVCAALRTTYRPAEMAGQVATVRDALGLPSNPSPRAQSVANGHRKEQRV